MAFISRISPILLAVLSVATLVVSTLGVVISRLQADAAFAKYQASGFEDQSLQQAHMLAVDAVNAWGSFVIVGAIGVLLTLAVFSLRRFEGKSSRAS